jgi:hypothetical protein
MRVKRVRLIAALHKQGLGSFIFGSGSEPIVQPSHLISLLKDSFWPRKGLSLKQINSECADDDYSGCSGAPKQNTKGDFQKGPLSRCRFADENSSISDQYLRSVD